MQPYFRAATKMTIVVDYLFDWLITDFWYLVMFFKYLHGCRANSGEGHKMVMQWQPHSGNSALELSMKTPSLRFNPLCACIALFPSFFSPFCFTGRRWSHIEDEVTGSTTMMTRYSIYTIQKWNGTCLVRLVQRSENSISVCQSKENEIWVFWLHL